MGLDSVEIIMEIEQTFGIAIPDAEAEKIITVGDLLHVVQSKVQHQSVDICLHQIVFFRLRKAFKASIYKKENLDLEINPNALLPDTGKRQAYQQLTSLTGYELPPLQLPHPYNEWFQNTILATVIFNIGLLVVWFFSDDGINHNWYYSGAGTVVLLLLLNALLRPLRNRIAVNYMRLFVEEVIRVNRGMLIQSHGINQSEIAAIVYAILMDKMGCTREELTYNAKLVDDLGIN